MDKIEITPEDRSAAVDAIRAVACEGFTVGCCNMSLCDADEMAAYIAKDFAAHRIRAAIEARGGKIIFNEEQN